MRGVRGWASGLIAALVVTACSSRPPTLEELAEDIDDRAAEDESDPVDDPPPPDPDPESEPEDPFAIPDEIDEAYVDLVMNELLAVDSEILRSVLSREPGDEPTDEEAQMMRAVFSGPRLIKTGEDYYRYSTQEDWRIGFVPANELGTIRWSTELVVESKSQCLVAIGYYDITEVAVEPFVADQFTAVSLDRFVDAPAGARLRDVNATPWRIHDMNLLRTADGDPIPPEDWERINFEPTLAMTCDEEPEP